MIDQQLDWVGLTVDGYSIEELVGEGAFSCVYRGINLQNDEARAFKVAKPPELIGKVSSSCLFPTRAVGLITDAVIDIEPDPRELLILQTEKLGAVHDPALPKVEEVVHEESATYCRMEFIAGRSLRQILQKGRVPMRAFIQIARCMERLTKNPEFSYHGDLKPENVMVTASAVKIVDPGYFGRMVLPTGSKVNCAITTPSYYPTLEPDDLFAFGLMLWEAATGEQPLRERGSSKGMDLTRVGSELLEWVQMEELVGRYFLSPILGLTKPLKHRAGMVPDLELLLLKALGLEFKSDGKLDKGASFASFGSLADALEDLAGQGVKELS